MLMPKFAELELLIEVVVALDLEQASSLTDSAFDTARVTHVELRRVRGKCLDSQGQRGIRLKHRASCQQGPSIVLRANVPSFSERARHPRAPRPPETP